MSYPGLRSPGGHERPPVKVTGPSCRTSRVACAVTRELLLAGRVPESWIPPDQILDLRARVRLRHTLIDQHCEWQQRIQSVLYHHGCSQRRGLMVGDGRDWLATQPLPETGRKQITVALAMITRSTCRSPLDRELRAYARAQTGSRALIDAYYGIGELTAVTDRLRARRLPAVCQL